MMSVIAYYLYAIQEKKIKKLSIRSKYAYNSQRFNEGNITDKKTTPTVSTVFHIAPKVQRHVAGGTAKQTPGIDISKNLKAEAYPPLAGPHREYGATFAKRTVAQAVQCDLTPKVSKQSKQEQSHIS